MSRGLLVWNFLKDWMDNIENVVLAAKSPRLAVDKCRQDYLKATLQRKSEECELCKRCVKHTHL